MNVNDMKMRFKEDMKGFFEYYIEHSAQTLDRGEVKEVFDKFAIEVGGMENLAGISIVAVMKDGAKKTMVCGTSAMLVLMAGFLVDEVEDTLKEPLADSVRSMLKHYMEKKYPKNYCWDSECKGCKSSVSMDDVKAFVEAMAGLAEVMKK